LQKGLEILPSKLLPESVESGLILNAKSIMTTVCPPLAVSDFEGHVE